MRSRARASIAQRGRLALRRGAVMSITGGDPTAPLIQRRKL